MRNITSLETIFSVKIKGNNEIKGKLKMSICKVGTSNIFDYSILLICMPFILLYFWPFFLYKNQFITLETFNPLKITW